MEHKICTKCKRELPATNDFFRKQKNGVLGLRPDCKNCCAKRDKKYYKNNKEKWVEHRLENADKIKDRMDIWRKENKDHVKTYRKKYYKENKEDILKKTQIWRSKNDEHLKQYREQYHKENRDQILAQTRIYNRTESAKESRKRWRERNIKKVYFWNRRRMHILRSSEHDFNLEDWEECLSFFGNKDAYTGKEMLTPSQDHIIPVSKGGGYTRSNIVPCDATINSMKQDRDMLEWYKEQPFFSEKRLEKIKQWINSNA